MIEVGVVGWSERWALADAYRLMTNSTGPDLYGFDEIHNAPVILFVDHSHYFRIDDGYVLVFRPFVPARYCFDYLTLCEDVDDDCCFRRLNLLLGWSSGPDDPADAGFGYEW